MKQIVKILNILIPLLFLTIIFAVVDTLVLLELFRKLSALTILVLVAISLVMVLVSAMKWQLFLDYLGASTHVAKLFGLYLVGYFVNLVIPSFVGGDATRSFQLGKSVGQHRVAVATIMERYTGFTAMLLLGCIMMNFSSLVTWQIKISLLLLLGIVLFLTALAMSPQGIKVVDLLPYGSKVSSHLLKLQDGIRMVCGAPKVLLQSYFLSFLYHCLTVLNTYSCALAVGWTPSSIKDLFVVLPLILTIGALPIAPQGLGIQEGAFYFFLTHLGSTPEQSVGIAFLLRAKGYLLAAVGGIILAFKNKLFADKS